MKIGILGGTFDPIHSGHLAIASAAQKQFHLDKVLFIPAFIPPHKANKRNMTPAPYRYRMVELAIRDIPGFEASDMEFSRPDLSYTVDTLRELERKYQKTEFFLILGFDAFKEFETWKEPEEIKRRATLLVAPREQSSIQEGDRVYALNMATVPLSSTDIRAQLEADRDNFLNRNFFPRQVVDYILKMDLYKKDKLCN